MLQRAYVNDDPFVIFLRDGSRNWSMRYTLNGKQIKTSLRTDDEQEARRRANKIWHEQNYKLEQGLSIKQHPFSDVAEEFAAKIVEEVGRGERTKDHETYWLPKIKRFFVGYFGSRPIESISPADMERYVEWRKAYWTTGPGAKIDELVYRNAEGRIFRRAAPRKPTAISTLKGEMVILRAIFKQAVRWGYRGQLDFPDVQIRKPRDNRRPGFTQAEYDHMISVSLRRISEQFIKVRQIKAKDGRVWSQRVFTEHMRADRTRLHGYIELMGNTGMRPTEAKNLTWRDILLYRESRNKPIIERDARLQVRGKGKHGTAVPLFGALAALDMLWDLFVFEVGREPNDEDPVFAGSDGKAIKSFKRSFTELLKAAGLEKDYRGVTRTTYSLRHYYISAMIAQNVSVHHIARNTRTSLEMIDKHYAQVSTEEIKDYLRPGQADFGMKAEQFPQEVQEEIDLLERRISELKSGQDRASTLAKLGNIYDGAKPTT